MQKKVIIITILVIVVIGAVVGGYLVLNKFGKLRSYEEMPCNWVYKLTDENYSSLVGIVLTDNETGTGYKASFSSGDPILLSKKITQGYYASEGCYCTRSLTCPSPYNASIAFTSITVDKWNQAINTYKECIIEAVKKGRAAQNGSLTREYEQACINKDNDYLKLENLQNYVMHYNTTNELYMCPILFDDLSWIINSNELAAKCKKVI